MSLPHRPAVVTVAVGLLAACGIAGLLDLVTYPAARSAIGVIRILPNKHNPRVDLRDSAILAAVIGAVVLIFAVIAVARVLRPGRGSKQLVRIGAAVVIIGELISVAGGSGSNAEHILPTWYQFLQGGTQVGTVAALVAVLVLTAVRPGVEYFDKALPTSPGAADKVWDVSRVGQHGDSAERPSTSESSGSSGTPA